MGIYLLLTISILITVIALYKQLQLFSKVNELYDKNNDLENRIQSYMETQDKNLDLETKKLQKLILENVNKINESIELVVEKNNTNSKELINNIDIKDENIKNYIENQKKYIELENIEIKKYISENVEQVISNIEDTKKHINNENNIAFKKSLIEVNNEFEKISNLINDEINNLINYEEDEKKKIDKVLFEINDNKKNINLLKSEFNVIEEIFRMQLVNYLIDDANDAIKLLKEKSINDNH